MILLEVDNDTREPISEQDILYMENYQQIYKLFGKSVVFTRISNYEPTSCTFVGFLQPLNTNPCCCFSINNALVNGRFAKSFLKCLINNN